MNADAETAQNKDQEVLRKLGGRKFQIWSSMSTCGDQYICMTNKRANATFVAKATGTVKGRFPIVIEFESISPTKFWCYMKIVSNGKDYRLSGTSSGVNAVPVQEGRVSPDEEIWQAIRIIHDWTYNVGFYVLQSKKKENGKEMYLSSDGAGNLTVKPVNSPPSIKNPFKNNPWIDVSLLFKAVEPTS